MLLHKLPSPHGVSFTPAGKAFYRSQAACQRGILAHRAHLLPRYVFSMSPTEDRMDPMSYRRRSTVI